MAYSEYLTDEEKERLDHMCKAAGDSNLGTVIKAILAALDALEARIAHLEALT